MLSFMPQFFNQYRKGLQAFALFTRDGHLAGYLWAMTKEAAITRAERLIGAGAYVDQANTDAHDAA